MLGLLALITYRNVVNLLLKLSRGGGYCTSGLKGLWYATLWLGGWLWL
jgi:hypothetical protein